MALGKLRNKANPYNTGPVQNVTIGIGAESANTVTVTITVRDVYKRPLTRSVALNVHLATLATGLVLAAAPAGGVAVGGSGGLIEEIAERRFTVLTTTAGVATFVVTDVGTYSAWVIVTLPDGTMQASATAITLA